MRYLLILFLQCSISSIIFAQDTIATYFDAFGNPTTNVYESSFFRSKINPSNPTKTYYWGDSLGENRAFKPSQIAGKNGRFVFLNSTKTIIKEMTFNQNRLDGMAYAYYDNGKIMDVEFFKNGLQDSTATYYYDNGAISAIEQYESDSLVSFELFNEDGTKDTITKSAVIQAKYPGGLVEMKKYLANNIRYPQNAVEMGLEGKCYLQFNVDENGKIEDIKIMRGVPDCPECDMESIRVIKEMPNWIPAKIHNRYSESIYRLPVSFKLAGGKKKTRGRR